MTTTPVLKKIDALRNKIVAHRPLDAHMLKQVREYFRIGKGISEASGSLIIRD
jgi:hypothetical protein